MSLVADDRDVTYATECVSGPELVVAGSVVDITSRVTVVECVVMGFVTDETVVVSGMVSLDIIVLVVLKIIFGFSWEVVLLFCVVCSEVGVAVVA